VTPAGALTGFQYWIFLSFLVIGAACSWGFVGFYTVKYRWWTNSIGQNLIALSAIVGAFYSWYLVNFFWPTMPGKIPVRTVLFFLLTVVLVRQVRVFIQVTRELERTRQGIGEIKPRKEEDSDA
jgi:hypothetical protein